MGIAVRQVGHPGDSSGGQYFNFPGGAVLAGSLLLWIGAGACPDATYTQAAVWTVNGSNVYLYRKIAAGGESHIDVAYNTYNGSLWCEVTGVDTASPLDGATVVNPGTSGQHSLTSASVTNLKSNNGLIVLFGNPTSYPPQSGTEWSVPAGMTNAGAWLDSQQNLRLVYQVGLGSGATGGRTANFTDANNYGASTLWALSLAVRSANSPPTAPTVTAPNGGENINNSVNVTWTAGTDPDGDALTYDIDYSANNGASWTAVATGVSGTSYTWNTTALANGSSYLVRVRSKDPSGATSAYDQSNAVFTVQHNQPPNPATWVSPASNATLDRSVAQTLTFQFNDPNAGDVLTKFDYRYRLVGAPTWTSTGTITGSTPSLTLAAGSVPAGTYEFQVLTYDGQGVAATGWSASLQEVFADAPAAPVITTPASGGIVSTATGIAAWTTGAQTDFQVQRVRDNAGAIDVATVYQDTGIVTSTTARDTPLNFETNNRYEWIRIRIRNNGLWSAWSSVRYQVSYTTPANPAMTFTYLTASPDAIQVNITNPTPSGTQPAVSKIELWRRARTDIDGNVITGPDAYANRVANLNPTAGGVTSFIDYTLASGVQYEYQAVILGVNNTWSYSPWVS